MSDLPDYIFGIGPGRCGTKSLAALLSACDGVEAIHEGNVHIRWKGTGESVEDAYEWLYDQTNGIHAATGYKWLRPAEWGAAHKEVDVRVVGLIRPESEFVESARQRLDAEVLWGNGREAERFPPAKSWGEYWHTYVGRMCSLYARNPDSVTLLPTAVLNDPQRVLDACGVPPGQQTSQTFHLNRRLHA